jgi:2-oxoglutarate dehydrogenase E2 component (dihydrolipoamide succinyltransferase)
MLSTSGSSWRRLSAWRDARPSSRILEDAGSRKDARQEKLTVPKKIMVPDLGESVVEATVSRWLKKEGDLVALGEAIVELETDKVNVEVGSEVPGVLSRILKREGEDVRVGEEIGIIEEAPGGGPEAHPHAAAEAARTAPAPSAPEQTAGGAPPPAARPASPHRAGPPAVATPTPPLALPPPGGLEERIRMSRRRRTIAERLLEAQKTAAMLTTFNEVDMSAVMDLRKEHKDSFKERHGVSLGILSFFVKASVGALKAFPLLNAEVQGEDIVVKRHYDLGIAVGASEGLVVPVLRSADRLSIAEIEKAVKDFAGRAEAGTLSIEDLRGGTFTITNGGVFGSLLSTPILSLPEVGILGLHKIEERPVALQGQVMIRPMMYLALTYDHRIVDGREAVQFLVKVKELVEDPRRLLLEP